MIATALLLVLGYVVLRWAVNNEPEAMALSPKTITAVAEWDLKRRQAWRRTMRRAKEKRGPIPWAPDGRTGWYNVRPTNAEQVEPIEQPERVVALRRSGERV